MLMSEEVFQQTYGDPYHCAMQEAREVIAHPEKLREMITVEKQQKDRSQLHPPSPDPYAYRLMRYRGFVRFPERLKNFIISQHEPRGTTRSFLPTLIDVEPVSRCNFRCVMCPISEWNGKRAEDLTFDQFKALLEIHPYPTEIKLQGLGEPLLHRHLFDMIRFAAQRDIWVRTTVNGSLLHLRDNARRLIDSGIGEVQTSFDGATKDVFEAIRRHADFEQVVHNLTILNDYANQQDRPYTRMWVLVQKANRHQLLSFVEFATRMHFRRLTFSVGLVSWGKASWREKTQPWKPPPLTPDEQQPLVGLARREGLEITVWDSSARYTTDASEQLCPAVFGRASVTSDSRLVPCGMLGDPSVANLGSAEQFTQAWNGPIYQAFRKAHLSDKIPGYCRRCYKDLGE